MILKPGKQIISDLPMYGFDIETYDHNRKFYCASLFSDRLKKSFFSKDSFIDFIKGLAPCIIIASNLSFDFFGTFLRRPEIKGFDILTRGSNLLYAKTYVSGGIFNRRGRSRDRILFIDTFNYAPFSVDKWGMIIGKRKLDKPHFLGRKPVDKAQKEQLLAYNMRDSEITYKAGMLIRDTFHMLGATFKPTIASMALSLFRNRYLDRVIFRHEEDVIREQFLGYYGGRVEAFSRGTFYDYNYYDFNSLYPDVMRNRYPDPNSLRINHFDSIQYMMQHEGMTKVTVRSPDTEYPLLPYRADKKLIFPTGEFTGYYTNVELRHSLSIGYRIKKVYKSFYYRDICYPFIGYINDLYKKRMRYKKEGSPMQHMIKLAMNSLYGKFGQKFDERDNLIPFNHTAEELDKLNWFEFVGTGGNIFIRYKNVVPPAPFCIPIWPSYVTAYGRIKLHEFIVDSRPLYADTDSLITKKTYPDSMGLGDLKLEHKIKRCIIVKPKFYMIDDMPKIKGIGKKLVCRDFLRIISDPKVRYKKFLKIRESLRRDLTCNEIIDIEKVLSLEDDKRVWSHKFLPGMQEHSIPQKVINDAGKHTEKIIGKGPVEASEPIIC